MPAVQDIELDVEHACFMLGYFGRFPMPGPCPNGLVGPAEDGIAVVNTGVHIGPVVVSVEITAGPPPLDSAHPWEEIVEIRCPTISDEPAMFHHDPYPGPWEGMSFAGLDRLRAHALGRDTAYDLAVDEPTERYLLQFWAGAPDDPEEIVIRQTDDTGRRWRGSYNDDHKGLP